MPLPSDLPPLPRGDCTPGSRGGGSAPRNMYRASDDGWAASTQAMTMRVLRAIGQAEPCEDPHFATNDARVAHADELDRMTDAFVPNRMLEENVACFEDKSVTIGPVNDIRRFMADRHVHARGLLADCPGEAMRSLLPVRLSGTPSAIRRPAPRLGQDTRDVFECGPGALKIAAALEAGVVRAVA